MKKQTTLMLFVIVALVFAAGLVAQQGGAPGNQVPAGKQNPEIIAKLREIVSIRERLFRSEEVQIKAGRAPVDGATEAELVEARLRLAREEQNPNAVIAELRNLVAVHQRRLKLAEVLARDRLAPGDVEKIRVALLEAEIRLLKEAK